MLSTAVSGAVCLLTFFMSGTAHALPGPEDSIFVGLLSAGIIFGSIFPSILGKALIMGRHGMRFRSAKFVLFILSWVLESVLILVLWTVLHQFCKGDTFITRGLIISGLLVVPIDYVLQLFFLRAAKIENSVRLALPYSFVFSLPCGILSAITAMIAPYLS